MRIKSHPYRTYMPWYYYGKLFSSTEEQIKDHFDWITLRARALENGHHYGFFHADAEFRRLINSGRKAKERSAMQKIRLGNYDVELPKFKRDADWDYF